VKLGDIDLVSLDIHGTVLERLDAEPEGLDAPGEQEDEQDDEQDDDTVAGPIAIAVDLNEVDAVTSATTATPEATPAP